MTFLIIYGNISSFHQIKINRDQMVESGVTKHSCPHVHVHVQWAGDLSKKICCLECTSK